MGADGGLFRLIGAYVAFASFVYHSLVVLVIAYEALLMKLEQDIVYKGGIEFPREGADLKKYLPRLCAKHPEWDGQTRWNPQLKEIRDLIHAGKDYDRRQTSNKKKRSRGGEAR